MKYLATFHTHFDAVRYQKYIKGIVHEAVMKPVPRKLSSSCGSCVVFASQTEMSMDKILTPDIEKLYRVEGDEYELLIENE
ncbi:MAG TPA: DUF3343 domain-containing protein [Bacillota bacterium]|jgi:hypothetical protein|nr:DUF3343 domain-containing protein [Bacillota bacterium]